MKSLKLFMLILGCRPPGRLTEQHDIFFGIGYELQDLLPAVFEFWPEAKQKIHIDAWREVTQVNGYNVQVISRQNVATATKTKLFFINLGGYKPGEFEEYHYKLVVAADDKETAVKKSKETAFYKHPGFAGATSHIDDKYGIDVDDLHEINDILSENFKKQYSVKLTAATVIKEDELHIGYLPLSKL